MSAVDQLFADLRSNHQKALIPFFTAGDPDLATTADLVRAAASAGANLCEIGVPYSDPIADGPVIQASYQRALDGGFKLQQVFEMGRSLSAEQTMPLVTMVSYSIIFRVGLQRYVEQAKAAGYAGAIVPDLLVEEADAMAKICRAEDFSLIQLVTPTTIRNMPPSRMARADVSPMLPETRPMKRSESGAKTPCLAALSGVALLTASTDPASTY